MNGVSLALGTATLLAIMSSRAHRTRRKGSNDVVDWTYSRGELLSATGERIRVKKGRKGTWTQSFLPFEGDGIYLAVNEFDHGDHSKEILAYLTWKRQQEPVLVGRRSLRGNRPLLPSRLPDVEKIGYLLTRGTSDQYRTLYRSTRYGMPLRKAHGAAAWRQYRALESCLQTAFDEVRSKVYAKFGGDKAFYQMVYSSYEVVDRVVECAKSHPDVPADLSETLEILQGNMADYGPDYIFEFAPRNLAADRGQLVLVDVIVPVESLQYLRARQRREHKQRQRRVW